MFVQWETQERLVNVDSSIVAYLLVAVMMILMPNSASADVRSDQTVKIAADEVIEDDLYVFAETIIVDGTIKGDLIAFGKDISINGTIEGDLTLAGYSIRLNGEVQDDVRFAGYQFTLSPSTKIGDDFMAGGYTLTCHEGSEVLGELDFAGYSTSLSGTVGQKTNLAVASCKLNGRFDGDLKIEIDSGDQPKFGSEPTGITISDQAEIRGALSYRSPVEAKIDSAATIGSVNYERIDPSELSESSTSSRSRNRRLKELRRSCSCWSAAWFLLPSLDATNRQRGRRSAIALPGLGSWQLFVGRCHRNYGVVVDHRSSRISWAPITGWIVVSGGWDRVNGHTGDGSLVCSVRCMDRHCIGCIVDRGHGTWPSQRIQRSQQHVVGRRWRCRSDGMSRCSIRWWDNWPSGNRGGTWRDRIVVAKLFLPS